MSDLEAWLAFNQLELLPKLSLRILERIPDPKELFELPGELLMDKLKDIEGFSGGLLQKIRAVSNLDFSKQLKILEKLQAHIITIHDPTYPKNLKNIYDPPPIIFLRGERSIMQEELSIAVVGTRNATNYGKIIAENLAKDLSAHDVVVVSGLARGIDTAAHRGALSNNGKTIGVLGCGIDIAYPAENRALIEEIAQKGAIISEFPVSAKPLPWRFPARNRVISGLALGVLLIEAPERSGALITAEFALQQGREVFCVPGNINLPQSRGTHKLIKEGAKLIEAVDDIFEELGIYVEETAAAVKDIPIQQLSQAEQKVLATLSLQQKHIDQIVYETALTVAQVLTAIMNLELKGIVKRIPGNNFVRVR